jgi:GTP-binding protein
MPYFPYLQDIKWLYAESMIKCLTMKTIPVPKIAIVGRPNVGKSSLFNGIVGRRSSIVAASSGTTRDRLYAHINWYGKEFTIIDTAGFEDDGHGDMSGLVLKQLQKGIKEADIIFFVTDGIAEIMPQDRELAALLRKTSKRIYLIVNKLDRDSDADRALVFFELGLGEPYPVSAMQGRGIERLCNDLVTDMEKAAAGNDAEIVRVAIVGRPNVGKSSYLNSILSEDRVIVHPDAGTTRDAVDIDFNYKGKEYVLIDTAGIRHNAKKGQAVNFYGSLRSKEAIQRCDAAIVLIDGYEGLMRDDACIIDACVKAGKALVIAVNKWDRAAKGLAMSDYKDRLIQEMQAVSNYPVLFISCKTGKNVKSSLDVIWAVFEKSRAVIQPKTLDRLLKSLNNSVRKINRSINFKYLIQEGAAPPRFVLGAKGNRGLSVNFKRSVENFFRTAYDFEGTPIIIRFEKKSKIGSPA